MSTIIENQEFQLIELKLTITTNLFNYLTSKESFHSSVNEVMRHGGLDKVTSYRTYSVDIDQLRDVIINTRYPNRGVQDIEFLQILQDKSAIVRVIEDLLYLNPKEYKFEMQFKDRCSFGMSTQVFKLGDLDVKPLRELKINAHCDVGTNGVVKGNILKFDTDIDLFGVSSDISTLHMVDHTACIQKVSIDELCVVEIPSNMETFVLHENEGIEFIKVPKISWLEHGDTLESEFSVPYKGGSINVKSKLRPKIGNIYTEADCSTYGHRDTKLVFIGYTVSAWV